MQKTDQENFWQGSFGDEYTQRNQEAIWVPSNTALFSKVIARTQGLKSVLEFGSNLGLNLHALHNLLPSAELSAIEINDQAVAELKRWATDQGIAGSKD